MKRKIMNLIFVGILLLGFTGCGKVKYTENILLAREHYQPWYLSSRLNGGEVYDRALRHQKWEDTGDQVIVSGIDKKTRKKIVVIYEVKKNNRVEVVKMTVNGEEKSYFDWYDYMTKYID